MKLGNYKRFFNLKIIGLILFLALLWQVEAKRLFVLLFEADFLKIVGSWVLMAIHVLMKVARYHNILKVQGIKVSFLKTLQCSLAAIFLSSVTPGRVGEFSKAYFISKLSGKSPVRIISGALVDRVFDVATLLLVAVLGISYLNLLGANSVLVSFSLMLVMIAPFIFISPKVRMLFQSSSMRFIKGKSNPPSWISKAEQFFRETVNFFRFQSVYLLVISFIAYLVYFASCYLMSEALMIPLSFQKISYIASCAIVISFLPISVAGIGTRDAAFVYFFALYGLSAESALALSFLIFVCAYLLLGTIGFISLMTLNYSRKDLLKNS